ncbi:hypothetical protein JTE90_024694 [Oedothorax gibbosus]|uniref:Uncharacterized protein n=1 Tax=Oedothorax gibbosus TaxID=931172 RepID=A0AAV6U9Q7_9ARAC|nr:hypothetical protein JTE90_024694 [Oedothorax gibbosus]
MYIKRIFYDTDVLLKARKRAKEAEVTSDVGTTDTDAPRPIINPYSEDSEDSADSPSLLRNQKDFPNSKSISEVYEPLHQSTPLASHQAKILAILVEIREQNNQILQSLKQRETQEASTSKAAIELPVHLPISNEREYLKLETHLGEPANFSNFCIYLSARIWKGDVTRAVNFTLRHIFTDHVASLFNFKGTKEKKPFGSTSLCCVLIRQTSNYTTRDRYEIAPLALREKVPPMEFYEPFCGETKDLVLVEQKMQLWEKGLSRLTRIKTEGQCETMLHTISSNVPLRRKAGATIKVQSTSIARRSATVVRGNKRLFSRRPVTASSSKKRKHNLSYNVKLNQPNAKKNIS